MRNIRLLCWILTAMLIVAGIVAGIREVGALYSNTFDRIQYVVGSVIGILVYVAGVWVLYGIIAGARFIVLRQRQHQSK